MSYWDNYDVRDLIEEPDHTAGHMFGLRHVSISAHSSHMSGIRIEWIDEQASTLSRHRGGEGSFYLHTPLRQGHTYLGQVLGAGGIGAGGGAGAMAAVDWYRPEGRFTIDGSQMMQRNLGIFESTGVVSNRTPDVQYTLGGHYIRRRGPVELSIGVTGVYELNRLFTHDATNLNCATSLA